EGGIAFWAHIGGFIAGLVLILPFRNRGTALFGRRRRGPWGRGWGGGWDRGRPAEPSDRRRNLGPWRTLGREGVAGAGEDAKFETLGRRGEHERESAFASRRSAGIEHRRSACGTDTRYRAVCSGCLPGARHHSVHHHLLCLHLSPHPATRATVPNAARSAEGRTDRGAGPHSGHEP